MWCLFMMILSVSPLFSQAPPPPPVDKGSITNKGPGGGASLRDGIVVLVSMVGAFAAWKMLKITQKQNSEKQIADLS